MPCYRIVYQFFVVTPNVALSKPLICGNFMCRKEANQMASKVTGLLLFIVVLLGAGCYENEAYTENRERQARYERVYYSSGEQYTHGDYHYYSDGTCYYCNYRRDGSSVCGEKRWRDAH